MSKLVPVGSGLTSWHESDLSATEEKDRWYAEQLEEGNIPFFARAPLDLPDADRCFLLGQRQSGGSFHKNIAYRPLQDRVTGLARKTARDDEKRLLAIMRRYSGQATQFLAGLLPQYAQNWRLDYTSFRPFEERGRRMRQSARNDLLHIDAFPTRPTHGDRILRFFTNINPTQPRVWLTGPTFEVLASQLAVGSGLLPQLKSRPSALIARQSFDAVRRALEEATRALGIRMATASPYDRFMHHFHNYLKQRSDFQRDCAKNRWEFPAGSSWMVFTDGVSHAVLSGQFALEQTYIVPRSSLVLPQKAPASILENLCGWRLAD